MRYFRKRRDEGISIEMSKEAAKDYLTGCWKDEFLEDIFENDKAFRLFTPFSEVWTKSDDGLVPAAGFYGVCE